jgi:hypothetical protein
VGGGSNVYVTRASRVRLSDKIFKVLEEQFKSIEEKKSQRKSSHPSSWSVECGGTWWPKACLLDDLGADSLDLVETDHGSWKEEFDRQDRRRGSGKRSRPFRSAIDFIKKKQ